MSADPFTDEAIADIRRQIAEALRNGTWGPGVSSHQTVAAPTPDYPRGYPVAEFKHASDAMLCDSLLHLMPAALDAIERLRAELDYERQRNAACNRQMAEVQPVITRREQLLREAARHLVWPHEALAAKIRAELEGGA